MPALLLDLPRDLLVTIMFLFLNDAILQDEKTGAYKMDEGRWAFLPNPRHDPDASQGLAIVWKLVCKAFHKVLPWPVEGCPLIELCDTPSMLEFVRNLWNPECDSYKDVKLWLGALDSYSEESTLGHPNSELQQRMPQLYSLALVDFDPEDLRKFTSAFTFKEVLDFFQKHAGKEIRYMDLLNQALRNDKYDAVKWFLYRHVAIRYNQDKPNFEFCLSRAIRSNSPNAVRALYDAKDWFEFSDGPLAKAIPLAAQYGKLGIVKLLHRDLGLPMDKAAMKRALENGHMDVAEYANRFAQSRCTVLDMIHSGNAAWTPAALAERDRDYTRRYEMPALEHLKTYTRKTRQDDCQWAVHAMADILKTNLEAHAPVGNHRHQKRDEAKRKKEENVLLALNKEMTAQAKGRRRFR